MKIRLVAYRPATPGVQVDTTYELEFTKAPNVSLNFQFSDIKNPETRKGNYSQTFKLPFTNKNHAFFENWYNVNLDKLVFSTKTKFNATLFVGTVPQFEGYLQLKAVYQKAQVYEVILMSNTADVFSAIGERKLKDVFLNADGSYSNELNHIYKKENIQDSWDGASSDFTSDCATCSGASLRDADADVQKVMYPLAATRPNFVFTNGSNRFLDMTDDDIDDIVDNLGSYEGMLTASYYTVNIDQLRPAIQIKTLFKLIFARAGFSYTSTFIDGEYFGKLFMTLGGHLESEVLPTPYPDTQNYPLGAFTAVADSSITSMPYWVNTMTGSGPGAIYYPFSANVGSDCSDDVNPPTPITFRAESVIEDTAGVMQGEGGYMFKKVSPSMYGFQIRGNAGYANVLPTCGSPHITISAYLYDPETGALLNIEDTFLLEAVLGDSGYDSWQAFFDISELPVGQVFSIGLQPPPMMAWAGSPEQPILSLFADFATLGQVVNSKIWSSWLPYNPSQYDKEVLIPSCIDPEISQKQFLQDIIQRFNLIMVANPDDESNIIIEPYNKYISGGVIKDWTDKLDTAKEIVISDTTNLQKKLVHFTDKEDVDLMNKSIKEAAPTINVYGKYFLDQSTNQFASGEMKNTPLFSPYINQKIFKENSQTETDLDNVAIQYEISYKQGDDGSVENELIATQPKIFYYCGKPTDIKNSGGEARTIYLHQINPDTSYINARGFTKYPVCTVWDINTITEGPDYQYTLTTANRSLYWDFAPPVCGEINVFNYSSDDSSVGNLNNLFPLYWEDYLNALYSEGSRVLIAYFNLTEVDIFQFKFNDEIFIKDSWWRIQNIHNYQVGAKASTKVTFLKKIDDAVALPQDCDYVVADVTYMPIGGIISWCPADDAGCTPDLAGIGIYAPTACCEAAGGLVYNLSEVYADQGLWICVANAGSLPLRLKNQILSKSILNAGKLKSIVFGKLTGRDNAFVVGTNSGKSQSSLLPSYGDDIVIKYKSILPVGPVVIGESHRMVLTGYTEGTATGYAYPRGDKYNDGRKMFLPQNSNVMLQVKGISTVVGGTDTTYVVGTTESFSYYTGFAVTGGYINQIGTVGGELEWNLREAALSITSTLEILTNTTEGNLEFGLKDSNANTKKTWTIQVDITVQGLPNLQIPFGENWAIWQQGGNIGLQNFDRLIWN
tara:strand:+ start:5190 stop:8726 length:3537 start_codon:yes stop_codon:yes gene_type:complete